MNNDLNRTNEIRKEIVKNINQISSNGNGTALSFAELLRIECSVLDNKAIGLRRNYEKYYLELLSLSNLVLQQKIEEAIDLHEKFGASLLKLDPLTFLKPKTENLRIGTIFGLEKEGIAKLKKDSLYFDKFAIWNNPELLLNPELEWLHNEGLLIVLDNDNVYNNALSKYMDNRNNEPYKLRINKPDDVFLLPGMIKKLSADILSSIDNFIGIPYYISDKEFRKDFPTGQTNCLSIIFKYLPVPIDDTPWERIIDFRNNPEVLKAKKALINWQNQINKTDKSASEITDEVEYLLSIYEHQLKLQKIKFQRSTFEIVIVTIAEIADDLKSLKFKSAAEKLFSFDKRYIEFEQEKEKISGKEIAYLSLAREAFGK